VNRRQRRRDWRRRDWNKNERHSAITGGAAQWGQCHFHRHSYDLNVMLTMMQQMAHAGIGMWTGAARVRLHCQLQLYYGMNRLHAPNQRLGDLVRE
jgi:hypothetical protein